MPRPLPHGPQINLDPVRTRPIGFRAAYKLENDPSFSNLSQPALA